MVWVLIAVLAAVLLGSIALYNGLISLREQTAHAFIQIEIQLRRRHDLIPNVVETVKEFLGLEHDHLVQVIHARNRAVAASTFGEKLTAETHVTHALANIMASSEAHPDLREHEGLLSLQEELQSMENKIIFALQYYNDIVIAYNARLQAFPTRFVASGGGFQPRELFELQGVAGREVA